MKKEHNQRKRKNPQRLNAQLLDKAKKAIEYEHLAPGTNNFGPYYQNTGIPPLPIEYGNDGVSPNNPWLFPVQGVNSPVNTNVPETVPSPPSGGTSNPSNVIPEGD